jgi:hypothetical protein
MSGGSRTDGPRCALGSDMYSGPDRRRRRVYVTRNHEYHCKDGVCVAVRDVRTLEFLPEHRAIGRMASAAVCLRAGGLESIAPPEDATPGQRMQFAYDSDDRFDILTSSLEAIERPERDIVASYEPLEDSNYEV